MRAPFIPLAVQQKRLIQSGRDKFDEFREPIIRKLERDLEVELGNQYYLDLKKNYILKNDEEKYDIIPEIWEGHNIADFLDQNILEVYY